MTAGERREKIKEILWSESTPVSASNMARRFSVSRQIIVGDIALLRTGGLEIDATPRGYIIHKEDIGIIHQIVCSHTAEQLSEELNLLVDYGCSVIDVIVEHPIYGKLTGELHIESRYDVAVFIEKVNKADAMPLSALTEGVHIHTLSCDSEESFQEAKSILKDKGILISAD